MIVLTDSDSGITALLKPVDVYIVGKIQPQKSQQIKRSVKKMKTQSIEMKEVQPKLGITQALIIFLHS